MECRECNKNNTIIWLLYYKKIIYSLHILYTIIWIHAMISNPDSRHYFVCTNIVFPSLNKGELRGEKRRRRQCPFELNAVRTCVVKSIDTEWLIFTSMATWYPYTFYRLYVIVLVPFTWLSSVILIAFSLLCYYKSWLYKLRNGVSYLLF